MQNKKTTQQTNFKKPTAATTTTKDKEKIWIEIEIK